MEREVQSGILALLVALNIPHWRANAGGAYRLGKNGKPQLIRAAPAGTPDIVGWLPGDGRFLGIEVKRPGEKPSPEQIVVMRRINADGGAAFWTSDVIRCQSILMRLMQGWWIVMDADGSFSVSE